MRLQGRDVAASKLDGIADRLYAVSSRAIRKSRANMTEEIDIWRAAHLLVKRHGEDAAIVAAQRADELMAQGDLDGQRIWLRILATVRELQRIKPAAGERRN